MRIKKKYNKWVWKFLVMSILFDVFTTCLCIEKGGKEGNPVGLFWALIINFVCVFVILFFLMDKKFSIKSKVIQFIFFVGIWRFSVGLWNVWISIFV
jgi:hypothetical protein